MSSLVMSSLVKNSLGMSSLVSLVPIEIRLWMEGTLQRAPLERIRQFLQLITTGINQHFEGRATPVDIDILDSHEGGLGAHFPGHTS